MRSKQMFSLDFVYFFAVTVSYICVETMTQVNIKFIIINYGLAIDLKLIWLVNEHKCFVFYAVFPPNHQFVCRTCVGRTAEI